MGMWQLLLDRFAPLMDGDASALDQRDGVGGSSALVVTTQARSGEAPFSSGHGRSAFEGSASSLPS